MTTPILVTKLNMPHNPTKLVLRPRLLELMNEGLNRKLSIISSPAGFGKTTLVTEWITNSKVSVAWLSLDEKDNDITQFITYLVASLRTLKVGLFEEFSEAFQNLKTLGLESVLTLLINEIATVSERFMLILDDYHVIQNKLVNDSIIYILNHMPANMHIVMTTREDPPLPITSLRAQNQLIEIRTKDLRFTYSEVLEFINGVMSLNLADKYISILEARTEGWIAGLQLAAISMKRRKDIVGFIESFTGNHSFIADYLLEEVLKQLDPKIQSFLLQTSIVDRLCGSLCDALFLDKRTSGQENLEYLHKANLFVIPLDDEQEWYRYHHLFVDFLRKRLTKNYSNSTSIEGRSVATLHVRASQWFENNGLTSEAIYHALAAKDFQRASILIELSWSTMDKSLQATTWLSWVKKLPDEMIKNRPVLSVGYAWALLDTGEMEGFEQRLQDAERCLKIASDEMKGEGDIQDIVVFDHEEYSILPATIATARTYYAVVKSDMEATIKYSQEALDFIPEKNNDKKGIISVLLGLAQWAKGELETAYTTITKSTVDHRMLIVLLAEIRVEQGKLYEAMRLYEKGLQTSIKSQGITLSHYFLGLSKLKHMMGNLGEAKRYLQQSLEEGKNRALPGWRYQWYLQQAQLLESNGEFDKALNNFHEAEKYYIKGPIPDIQPLYALKARTLIKQGNIYQAKECIRENGQSIEEEFCYLEEFKHITLVRIKIASFRQYRKRKLFIETIELLESLLLEADRGNRIGKIVEILILQALAYEANDDVESAKVSLKKAINLAEPMGYLQVFVDEGMSIYKLLLEPLVYETNPDFVSRLRLAIEASSSQSAPKLLEPLSERELKVLKLIAEGLSNQEIGDRLFLALSTVKGYNQNIFGKLQVKRRTEAVGRARELGLL
ncbi:LuxR C-terminal-related transcriptional regulator [Evansella tamaricis]|uniref:LuxR C-terminal-related transcriptional regulator n=1 Tax=Evansella tamaricis TaxID=2069301 RepID=A0ABS6JCZ4_9BACI|nr:LuxR C-terminal-related transcriptional regulator [Evansella tamaricis]MBU9711542.1 LuxR C-terminal-related transcriptional regulator [Evansella tamaricis]